MPMSPPPPLSALAELQQQLQGAGWGVFDAATLAAWCGAPGGLPWAKWSAHWDSLPPDPHLRDGGRYRRRRHGCCIVEAGGRVTPVAHRAHWQPVEYNALHGGIERWFEPLPAALVDDTVWQRLLAGLAEAANALRPEPRWFVESHLFRIDTEGVGGIGRPTPEGAHRDGVDLVAVVLLARHNVKGGETRVFDAEQPQGMRFTLSEPGSVLLLDDGRVIHETTPIQPLDPALPAWRDTLVVTCRRGGFQGPDQPASAP
jgi:hypothetical protein